MSRPAPITTALPLCILLSLGALAGCGDDSGGGGDAVVPGTPGGDGDGDGDTAGDGDGDATGTPGATGTPPGGDGDTTGDGDGDAAGDGDGDGDTAGDGDGDGDTAGDGDGDTAGDGDGDGDTTASSACTTLTPSADPGNDCPAVDPVTLALTPVKSGLASPTYVTAAPGDTDRLFLVQRGGSILVLDRASGDTLSTFLDINDVVSSSGEGTSGERGLLGLTFHPDYPADPRFFVNYTGDGAFGTETVVAAYEVSSTDPNSAAPDSEQRLLVFGQPAGNHNGGMLAFGADNCLYIGTGDGGGGNDTGSGHATGGNGQSLDTQLGKLLRMDVDDPTHNAAGNMSASVDHIWDYGLRNPWRFSFDRATGDLYIGDVGQDAVEEVDVAAAGDGNKNWGWRLAEGSTCRPGDTSCDSDALMTLEAPVAEYAQSGTDNCVVGGYVYRGSAIPSLQGWYLYADNGSNNIRAFTWDGQGTCGKAPIRLDQRDSLNPSGGITSFGEDAAGELYITTLSGTLYRIDAAP